MVRSPTRQEHPLGCRFPRTSRISNPSAFPQTRFFRSNRSQCQQARRRDRQTLLGAARRRIRTILAARSSPSRITGAPRRRRYRNARHAARAISARRRRRLRSRMVMVDFQARSETEPDDPDDPRVLGVRRLRVKSRQPEPPHEPELAPVPIERLLVSFRRHEEVKFESSLAHRLPWTPSVPGRSCSQSSQIGAPQTKDDADGHSCVAWAPQPRQARPSCLEHIVFPGRASLSHLPT